MPISSTTRSTMMTSKGLSIHTHDTYTHISLSCETNPLPILPKMLHTGTITNKPTTTIIRNHVYPYTNRTDPSWLDKYRTGCNRRIASLVRTASQLGYIWACDSKFLVMIRPAFVFWDFPFCCRFLSTVPPDIFLVVPIVSFLSRYLAFPCLLLFVVVVAVVLATRRRTLVHIVASSWVGDSMPVPAV